MQHVTDFFTQFPASSYYHALAFISTAFLTQYSVQIVKLLSKYSLGKRSLRFLNGAFNTLFVAAGALATGGISLGQLTVTAAALSTFSAVIYRIHSSTLYKSFDKAVDDVAATPDKPEIPQFAS